MLSFQIKFFTDRLTDRQTDLKAHRQRMVTKYAPDFLISGHKFTYSEHFFSDVEDL